MGRVEGEIDSIRKASVLDLESGSSSSVSTGTSTDSSIITLVAGESISANTIVSIGEGGKVFVASVYSQYSAIGISLDNAELDENINVKISGIVENVYLTNVTSDNVYYYTDGAPSDYFYEANGYLQFLGYKISDTQILLDIGKKVLML